MTSTIEKLENLQQLEIIGDVTNTPYPKKAIRAIYKGLNNLSKAKNSLELISYFRVSFQGNQNEITECIFSPLSNYLNKLQAVRLENS